MNKKSLIDALMMSERGAIVPQSAPYMQGGTVDGSYYDDMQDSEFQMGPMQGRQPIQPVVPSGPPMAIAQASAQVPPVPQGVVPGTDDYFAWLESTGIAKTPDDFKRIMQIHESQMQSGGKDALQRALGVR